MKKWFKGVKAGYLVAVVILIALIVFRLCLPGIVENYVNKKLNELPGYTGHVNDIDIHLWRCAYTIKGLELRKKTDPPSYPFLKIASTDLALQWRSVFKGRLVGKVDLQDPSINIIAGKEDIDKEPSKDSWTKTVKALMPITINKLTVNNGMFAYRDFEKKPNTDLFIDNMQLTALNLANVQKTGSPLPSYVTLTGRSVGRGNLKADAHVNVLKNIPDFDLNLQLTGVNITSLNGFLEANAKFDVERGSIDVYSKLRLNDAEMDGYIKPFIKNLKVLNVKKDIKKKNGLLVVAKKAVIGLFTDVVKNPKTKKIATVAPIKGNIRDPKTSGWKTFVGILKNAFIKAYTEGITQHADAG